jgi:hypothetical protein
MLGGNLCAKCIQLPIHKTYLPNYIYTLQKLLILILFPAGKQKTTKRQKTNK